MTETKAGASGGNPSGTAANPSVADQHEINQQPVCLIVLGMAGSGKTQFVKKLTQFGDLKEMSPYVVNLDPACREVPYHANIGETLNIK